MTRLIPIALALALSGCGFEIEKRGYVLRSVSVDAAPGSVGLTVTFDNLTLPESGGCLEICAVGAVE